MKAQLAALLILGLLCGGGVSLAAAGQEHTDLKKVAEQIRGFESLINENLAQTMPGPFAYLDKARGAYLPGYGIVFTFILNLSSPSFPFETGSTPERERARQDELNRRREQAKAVAQRVLADSGYLLSELAPTESAAIVIQTVNVKAQSIDRSTIVVRAGKETINAYRANTLDRNAFLHKLQVVEY